jgi:hypothetical protein
MPPWMFVGVVFSAQLGRTTPYSILPLLVEVFPNYNEGLAPPMSLRVCVLSWGRKLLVKKSRYDAL